MVGQDVVVSSFAHVEAVSSTDLHVKTRDALERVRQTQALVVTHYNEVDAYLVSPARMGDLLRAESRNSQRDRELAETVPLLLAAARAGVGIPSETLERVAPGLDSSWQAVAEFAARWPVHLHAGEDGEPLARGHLHAAPGPFEESGDDDELNLDA